MKKLIQEANLQNRRQFSDAQNKNVNGEWIEDWCEQEARLLAKFVPEAFVAVSSESDGAESEIFGHLAHFFGQQVYKGWGGRSNLQPRKIKERGLTAFTTGEMTWSILINPADLETILGIMGVRS